VLAVAICVVGPWLGLCVEQFSFVKFGNNKTSSNVSLQSSCRRHHGEITRFLQQRCNAGAAFYKSMHLISRSLQEPSDFEQGY
jgi:hypothetical protein